MQTANIMQTNRIHDQIVRFWNSLTSTDISELASDSLGLNYYTNFKVIGRMDLIVTSFLSFAFQYTFTIQKLLIIAPIPYNEVLIMLIFSVRWSNDLICWTS